MNKDGKTSISLIKIIVISIIIISTMGIAVYAGSLKINNIKIILENGYEMSVLTNKVKVSEILEDSHIVLSENERVLPDLEENISDNKTIKIINKTDVIKKSEDEEIINVEKILENYNEIVEKFETVEEIIPFETITKDISDGSVTVQESITKAGENGLRRVTYKVKYQNDVEIDRVELSSEVIKEPVNKIVEVKKKTVTTRSTALSRNSVTYNNGAWSYSASDFDLLCAITAQECSSSYDGALAVITCACNRAESSSWGAKGRDPLSQYKARGQFCYSIDGNWRRRTNGNYSKVVEQAVRDALNGKRNHDFLSFRSARSGKTGTVIGGNVYFNKK